MRRRLSPLVCTLIAIASVVAIPVVFVAGAAYGIESQEWDPVHSTYFYDERPGGGFVVIGALLACVALAALAFAAGNAALNGRRASRVPG
ncbi:hypothetical protein [Microbacterium sp. A1-JK]|uniref:hypothetical protein n=1 Tax=Microbacterium sp. A1-JK TaxID=3177516 RepID=UPI00388A41F8